MQIFSYIEDCHVHHACERRTTMTNTIKNNVIAMIAAVLVAVLVALSGVSTHSEAKAVDAGSATNAQQAIAQWTDSVNAYRLW